MTLKLKRSRSPERANRSPVCHWPISARPGHVPAVPQPDCAKSRPHLPSRPHRLHKRLTPRPSECVSLCRSRKTPTDPECSVRARDAVAGAATDPRPRRSAGRAAVSAGPAFVRRLERLAVPLLAARLVQPNPRAALAAVVANKQATFARAVHVHARAELRRGLLPLAVDHRALDWQIGRASCRERVS